MVNCCAMSMQHVVICLVDIYTCTHCRSLNIVNSIQKRKGKISEVTWGESTTYILQRLSVAVQGDNAASMIGYHWTVHQLQHVLIYLHNLSIFLYEKSLYVCLLFLLAICSCLLPFPACYLFLLAHFALFHCSHLPIFASVSFLVSLLLHFSFHPCFPFIVRFCLSFLVVIILR